MSSAPKMAVTVVRRCGLEVALWLHTADDPPRDQWDVAIETIADHMQRNNAPVTRLRALIISDGGAPNVKQRGQLHRDLYQRHPCKSSVITTVLSNPLKRGVATALTWINPAFGFFEPSQIRQALSHVDLAREGHGILRDFAKLQASLPRVAALELATAAWRSEPHQESETRQNP